MKLKLMLSVLVLSVGVTARAEEVAQPSWGRVFGVYCRNVDAAKSPGGPAFPFHSQMDLNASATSASATKGTPNTVLIADDLAFLPADAFSFTGYVSDESDTYRTFTTPATLTPGAVYRMTVYVNEPYQTGIRSQYMVVNGTRLKDAAGADFWFDPDNTALNGALLAAGTNAVSVPAGDTPVANKVWKFTVSNVVAQADGTISWGFPRKGNKSVMNVVTIDGTNAVAKPVLDVAATDAQTVTLAWTPVRDVLGSYVERRATASDPWEPLAQTTGSTCVDTNVTAASYDYRVTVSNGLGTAVSDVVTCRRRHARVALHTGAATGVFGRFLPAGPFISSTYRPRTFTGTLTLPLALQDCADFGTSYVYLWSSASQGFTFNISNLAANASYDLRLWTMEPYVGITRWIAADKRDTFRRLKVAVNGTVATNDVSAWTLSGHRVGAPAPVDFTGTATAAGTMTVTVSSVADQGVVLGLELFVPLAEATNAPPFACVPTPTGVRLVADARSAASTYDYQYRDGADGTPTLFATNAPGWGVTDFTIPVGTTRSYRARVATADATGAWSAWVDAARGGRSPYEPLRVNHTRHATYQANPPAGWVDGEQFRTSVHEESTINSKAYYAGEIDYSLVTDPAPADVYRTQFYTADSKDNTWTFPGFDPEMDYTVRVHMMETWDGATANTRMFALAANGAVPSPYENLDVYVAAGSNHFRAVCFELPARPNPDGTVRLDVVHKNQNATIRGTEIIPARTNLTSASAQDATGLLQHAFIRIPVDGTYTFTAAANGRVRLWLDHVTCLLNQSGCAVETPVTSGDFTLAAGLYEVVFEYVKDDGKDYAVSLTWANDCGMGGTLEQLGFGTGGASPAPGAGWSVCDLTKNGKPTYAVATDSARGNYCITGHGWDMWGGTDQGNFLYHPANGTFEVMMKIVARGGGYQPNARFGLAVRSTLGTLSNDDFMLYAGISGDPGIQLKGYRDVDLANTTSITSWGEFKWARQPNLPVWLKFSRTLCPTNTGHRYVCAYSQDGEDWYFARTQDVKRVRNVYVGPVLMAHAADNKTTDLVFMNVEGLAFTDTTPRGTFIYVR